MPLKYSYSYFHSYSYCFYLLLFYNKYYLVSFSIMVEIQACVITFYTEMHNVSEMNTTLFTKMFLKF